MVEQSFPNFRVSNDVRLNTVQVLNNLRVREAVVTARVKNPALFTVISGPSSNITSSRILNDQTYNNAQVSGVLQIAGAHVNSPSTDEEWDAYRQVAMRTEGAQYAQGKSFNTTRNSNRDEVDIPSFIAMFSKTLNHDESGRVVSSDYQTLRDGINNRDIDLISSVPNTGTLKLVQPLGAFLLNFVGPASSSISLPAAPSMSSAESAGEMVEVYCKALARDIPFVDFGTDNTIATMVGYMEVLSNFKGPSTPVTTANIFRGSGDGDLIGPYLSQVFFLDAVAWPKTVTATADFPTRVPANDRMISSVTYLSAMNGTVTEAGPTLAGVETYPSTGRDLSYIVWKDDPGSLFELASKKVIDAGAPFSPTNPYSKAPLNNNQVSFITWSFTDLKTCLQKSVQSALTVAWYGKWVANRRLRPESFGNEVEQWRLSGMTSNPAMINSDLLTSGILEDVFNANSNNYLPQTYPEGSPSHPSYPAGHAVVSGACITIIKAFLDESWVFPSPVIPNAAGTMLSAIGDTLTLEGEINKLGSNMTLGRNWAGVHYRSDGHNGILQGESIAKVILQEWINRYPEQDAQFLFTGYLGDSISISPQNNFGRMN